jgi:ABC-type antimicrobial peptide transport system permease subunit
MSATGLFAMVSLNIIRKMKEIGVRKVFGASAANVIRVVSLEFVIIMAVASTLGGAIGFVAVDGMMDAIWEYYRKVDGITLLAATGLLFAVAILSAGHKALSALRVNPVQILRDE